MAGITLGKLQLQLQLTQRQRLGTALLGLASVLGFFFTFVSRVPYVLLHGGLLMPLFAILTIGHSGTNFISSAFSWRPLLIVGESTFCLYMLHFNGIGLMQESHLWQRLNLAALDPWISYAAIVAIAIAVHHLVEIPTRKAILGKLLTAEKPR